MYDPANYLQGSPTTTPQGSNDGCVLIFVWMCLIFTGQLEITLMSDNIRFGYINSDALTAGTQQSESCINLCY